jgi:hypothetical protein
MEIVGRNIWLNCFKGIYSKRDDKAGKILQCRTALLRSNYKQDRFYNAELLCGV